MEKQKEKTGESSSNKNEDKNDFQLEDLLEILQGPVPQEGQIIIATTNKFDEIYKECPALFRPGRLTPIEFGYLGSKEINKLASRYLGVNINIDFEPKMATSKIIEIITYAKIKNDPNYFTKELSKNMNYNYLRISTMTRKSSNV